MLLQRFGAILSNISGYKMTIWKRSHCLTMREQLEVVTKQTVNQFCFACRKEDKQKGKLVLHQIEIGTWGKYILHQGASRAWVTHVGQDNLDDKEDTGNQSGDLLWTEQFNQIMKGLVGRLNKHL